MKAAAIVALVLLASMVSGAAAASDGAAMMPSSWMLKWMQVWLGQGRWDFSNITSAEAWIDVLHTQVSHVTNETVTNINTTGDIYLSGHILGPGFSIGAGNITGLQAAINGSSYNFTHLDVEGNIVAKKVGIGAAPGTYELQVFPSSTSNYPVRILQTGASGSSAYLGNSWVGMTFSAEAQTPANSFGVTMKGMYFSMTNVHDMNGGGAQYYNYGTESYIQAQGDHSGAAQYIETNTGMTATIESEDRTMTATGGLQYINNYGADYLINDKTAFNSAGKTLNVINRGINVYVSDETSELLAGTYNSETTGIYVQTANQNHASGLDKSYGIYLAVGGSAEQNYGIYQLTGNPNYFAGSISIANDKVPLYLGAGGKVDGSVYWTGNGLALNASGPGAGVYVYNKTGFGNITAAQYFTASVMPDVKDGVSALDVFGRAGTWIAPDGSKNYTAHYASAKQTVTDYGNCWQVVDRTVWHYWVKLDGVASEINRDEQIAGWAKNPAIINETREDFYRTECGSKQVDVLNVEDRIVMLEKGMYEQVQENAALESENAMLKECVASAKDFAEMKACAGAAHAP